MDTSRCHLSHKLPWKVFLEADFFQSAKDPGIELPVGECGKIHVSSKKVQLQVDHRPYLSDKVCESKECETKGTTVFYKHSINNIRKPDLAKSFHWWGEQERVKKQWNFFTTALMDTVVEFAKSARKDRKRVIKKDEELIELCQTLRDTSSLPKTDTDKQCGGVGILCDLFIDMMELREIDVLLSSSNERIKEITRCIHGNMPHVGFTFGCLLGNVWCVYLYTNLIILYGLENDPEKWGKMKEDRIHRFNYGRNECRTFLKNCRKYLQTDVYMKDFGAMKELCKKCFEFLYIAEMVWLEVYGKSFTEEESYYGCWWDAAFIYS